jgi:aspartate/methionine/tyrosine aminotransferase
MDTVTSALRAAAVPPFHAMAMSRRATERQLAGRTVLHLEVGQPATGAPATAVAAVRAALDRPLGYTDAAGRWDLRTRIARWYAERDAVDVDPDTVAVTTGASGGFTLALLATVDEGARVGVIEPGYPCYRNTVVAIGGVPVPVAVGPDTRFAPTVELLDATGRLDVLIVASPSNPTGTVLDAERLAEIATWCRERGTALVVDEIYHGVTYGCPARTVLAVAPDAIVVNSFSKYFSMTGWRIGWLVAPPERFRAIERLQQNLFICAPHISQVAALAAFDGTAELDAHVRRYAAQRAVLLEGLAAAGIERIAAADGAFYVYADVSHLTERYVDGSLGLCNSWLDELGVATTPGIDFDLARGAQHVRFSYAGDGADVARACDLLAGWPA